MRVSQRRKRGTEEGERRVAEREGEKVKGTAGVQERAKGKEREMKVREVVRWRGNERKVEKGVYETIAEKE